MTVKINNYTKRVYDVSVCSDKAEIVEKVCL